MTRIPVDRGLPISGLQKTLRDHRVPFNMVRALKNYRLPDKRLRRRKGFEEYVAAATRYHGNQLAKHTGAKLQQSLRREVGDENFTRDPVWKTPFSYGVAKWHDDFQPKIGRDFTVEMLVTLGEEEPLVSYNPLPDTAFPGVSGFNRISPSRNAGTVNFFPRGISGVFIYDQCVVANDCTFNDGAGDTTLPTNPDSSALTNASLFDCVALPALSIAYNKAIDGVDAGKVRFEVEWTIIDTATNKYYRFGTAGLLKYAHEAYVEGKTYHLAVTYTASTGIVKLFLDGVEVDASTDIKRGLGANAKWAGEEDYINDIDRAIKRDIVLLNECTVRGNYSSTCAFLNRGSTTSTNVGDWTNFAANVWYTTLNGNAAPLTVYYHDRTPAAPVGRTVTSNYGKQEASTGALNANYEWFYDAATSRLYVYATANPVTAYKEIEIVFQYTGSPNVIPHNNEGSITSGANTVQISQPNPWCCTPPRGTALSQLRIWHESRSAANLLANMNQPLSTPFSANLKGLWDLRSGSGMQVDQVNGRKLTVHHGLPTWLKDVDMLGSLGISLADGQHLIKSFNESDGDLYVDDIHAYLKRTFHSYQDSTSYPYTSAVNEDPHGDFTAQLQLRTPYTFQQDIARHGDIVRNLGMGLHEGSSGTRSRLKDFSIAQGLGSWNAQSQGHRQTLFSIEGTRQKADPHTDTAVEATRIPLARGFIDDGGFVRFEQSSRNHNGFSGNAELFQLAAGKSKRVDAAVYTGALAATNRFTAGAGPFTAGDDGMIAVVQDQNAQVLQVSRVTYVSATQVDLEWAWVPTATDIITIFNPLDANTDYTITFRRKTEDRGFLVGSSTVSMWMDIFVDDTLMLSGRYTGAAYVFHDANYDIIVGASKVNDIAEESVCADVILSAANTVVGYPWFGAPPNSLNHCSQHFMTHHADEPGDFTVGFFRLWAGLGVSDELIKQHYNTVLPSKFHDAHLVFNLEMDQMTGMQIPNRCRYPAVFDMGYKSFGGNINDFLNSAPNTTEPHISLGWEAEDRLGHIPQPQAFDNQYEEAMGRMLAPYASTLRQRGGLLALMDSCLLYDAALDGSFLPVYVARTGMMNDFSVNDYWEGVVIGDRTVMLGQGGRPKVFNDRVCTSGGILNWTGGRIKALTDTTGGKLTKSRWYHLRLVYHDDYNQIQDVSPPILVQTTDTKLQIRLRNVPQHPDPRVTSIRLYATAGQTSYDLAVATTPQLTKLGALENVYYSGGDSGIVYGDVHGDGDLEPASLPLDRVPMPLMTTATSHNGRLVGGGHPLVPDAFFWSEAGNPETFLDSSFGILEEGTGDRIVKVISAFGAVFVFKTNSIWRLDETQPGSFNPWVTTRVASGIGATSPRAVSVHTDPDTGRSFIFFWSKHGPYIFDGVRTQYVGQPLEQGLDDPSWDWCDVTDAFSIHDVMEREIITFMKLAGNDRNDVAYAFNYRYSNFETGEYVWSEYTGMIGEAGTTILATTDDSLTDTSIDYGNSASLVVSYGDSFLPVFAGKNGKIYKWGTSDYDGHPDHGGDYQSKHTVSTYLANVVTVAGAPAWTDIRGMWVTVLKSDYSDSYIWPIKQNTANSFELDSAYGTRPWDPGAGDFIYLGRPPTLIELPWDMLDIPFKNKELHRILLWTETDHYYRWKRDWDTAWEQGATIIADSNKKRTHIDLAPSPSLEVFKLELTSYEVDSRIDSYGYIITPTDAEDIPQV